MTIILGKIDLKYNNFLQPEATRVRCVACQNVGLSTVHHECVTCLQHFVAFTKICKNWNNRHDINHYCAKCGCFLGRCMNRNDQENARDQLKPIKASKNWAESFIQDFKQTRARKYAGHKKDAQASEEKEEKSKKKESDAEEMRAMDVQMTD